MIKRHLSIKASNELGTANERKTLCPMQVDHKQQVARKKSASYPRYQKSIHQKPDLIRSTILWIFHAPNLRRVRSNMTIGCKL